MGQRWDAIDNALGFDENATKIIFDTGDVFSVGSIVKVPRTGECILVTAINPDGDNADEFTVVRGFGTTAAAALVNDDPVVVIGNVNEEGATAPAIKHGAETEVYNYTQIFRTVFGLTNTAKATSTYGGNDFAYQQKKKGIEHAVDMARSFYFGQLKLDTTGTHPKRSTRGLLAFLNQNNYDAGGALTQDEFDQNICEKLFLYGSKEKLLLASPRLLSVMNGWALGKLQVEIGETTFGLAVTKYVSPHGVLNIVPEPLFEGAVYGGYGVCLDVANVKYRPLKGRDTKLLTNIQANDADERKDEYLTEAGLEVRSPKTHAVITGVTS